ncbi:hypothetical protein [Desulfoluna spongiiphila]|uniref:hypothetical protein n=1 Tax=Desulfoluna spongiiphila TaxID=419481 RepID=UPI001255E982|nr:hypothetical protein [Desulfoluna spongiiphila]VVS93915.1 hypothetical protein DBB_34870 [Desulfoluna spongiiphila]
MHIKRTLQVLFLACALLTAAFVSPAVAAHAVIKINCCKPGGCYIVSKSRFGKRHQAKHFDSKEQAEAFIKTLSPRLKNMHPRAVESD